MQQKSNDFLGTERISKLLLRLAVPTVVAQLINMLYNIVDRIYIGHIRDIGSLALTGVGVCMPLIMIVSAFACLVSSGGAPRSSIFLGKGDTESAQKALNNCFSALLILSVVLTVVLFFFNEPLLLLFGASENTIGYAVDYMNIYALGTIFVQMTLGMNSFITAQGYTSVSMVSVVIGAVSNIILDPIFIFACNMGVKGAALATILSQALSCIWVLRFLTGDRSVLRLQKQYMRLEAKVILPCMALGLSMFIMQSTESLIAVCFNSSLLKYGGDIAVGAMTILTSVMQFAMLPLQGIAQGAQPIMSYNFGAKNPDRVKKAYFTLLKVNLIYSVLLWASVMLFPRVFAGIFTPDALLLDFTAKALRIYLAAMFLFGVQVACQIAFTSLGNAPASITVAVVRKIVLLIPLIYIMPHLVPDPVFGVYMAEPIADTLAVTFTAILFFFQFKKSLASISNN